MEQEYEFCILSIGPEVSDTKDAIVDTAKSVYNYLNLKSFSHEIRYGEKDTNLDQHLKMVKATNEKVINLINSAKESNQSLFASIVINIRVTDKAYALQKS